MKIKKSVLALVLTTMVGISVVGCGKEEKKASTEDKKTEVTASKEEKKDEEKATEEKKEDAKPAEEQKTEAPAATTGTTTATTQPAQATQQAAATTTTAPAATAQTTAPSTPAQKLDALVKGLKGTVRDATSNECSFIGFPKGSKVITYNGKSLIVGALNESTLNAAQKIEVEHARKNHYMVNKSVGLQMGAYYNAGIIAICGDSPAPTVMDSAVVKIMDTFK